VKAINLPIIVDFLKAGISKLQSVYVYGSYLTGTFSDASDLDLAFRAEARLDNVRRWQIQQQLAIQVGRDVDLLDLAVTSIVMQFEVITTGRRIYCADEDTTAACETLVYSRYLDFNETRRRIIEDIHRRGSIYGG
jgi:uncharacterized protein